MIDSGSFNVVLGNYIGTDKAGTMPLGNAYDGINVRGYSTHNTIGGTAPGSGNLLSADESGISFYQGSFFNIIQGNLIGTDKSGRHALGNRFAGVFDAGYGNTYGGTTAAARNVISGNDSVGLLMVGGSAATIEGNLIGTDATGNGPLGNQGDGVEVFYGAYSDTIGGFAAGAGNVIAFNGGSGVVIGSGPSDTAVYDAVVSNSIHDNGGLGIDLGADGVTPDGSGIAPNFGQNDPNLASVVTVGGVTTVTGTLQGTPGTTYTLQFFTNDKPDPSGYGEGKVLVQTTTVTADASGVAAFSIPLSMVVRVGRYLSATAADPYGDTSEFSADVRMTNKVQSAPASLAMSRAVSSTTFEADLTAVASDVAVTAARFLGAPARRAVAQRSSPQWPTDFIGEGGSQPG